MAGLYAGSRQLHFVGTNERAQVTLYRGLPYELPMGLNLYEADYESGALAREICPPRRGEALDQELRTRGDAADLVRQIEHGKLVC